MALYEVLEDGTIVPKAGKTVGNLDCLRTEVVYDMSSSDKRLGYPNGIPASIGVTINANKYYELKVYYVCFNDSVTNIGSTSNSLTLNLSNSLNDVCFADDVGGLLYNGGVGSAYFNVRVQYWKTTQQIALYPFFNGTLQSSALYYISKIEGVLKTPAMIYTGKELFAGEGVHIDGGVISGLKSETVWSGRNGENWGYLGTEITMDLDLSKYKFVEFFTTIGQTYIMDMSLLPVNKDPSFNIVAEQYYSGSWHAGAKCQAIYYVDTKTLKWNGHYIGLIEVKGWW